MSSDNKKLSVEQCKDAGLALVLLELIGYQFWKLPGLMIAAICCLLLAMTWPAIFRPFARIWFSLSEKLGSVVSRVILTLLFFALVLPVGRIRRMLGKDAMQSRGWNDGTASVFRERNHHFTAGDLKNPY